jgi:serine protease SohB
MEFLQEIGIFFVEAVIIVVSIGAVLALLASFGQRRRHSDDGYIEVRCLNERYKNYQETILSLIETPKEAKKRLKAEKKAEKASSRAPQEGSEPETSGSASADARVFLLDFEGDMRATQVDALREEISAILAQASEADEVILRLESPGGVVHGYGLAASQLQRIRDAGLTLTVCVDTVAASGGYMMACVAERIIAAPFAVIGSIGVVAQIPNFHRLLKKNDIDYDTYTAGEYKRTLTLFGENTEKGRLKFIEELEETHALFKQHVLSQRPEVDIATVSTGEIWYGQQALAIGLVDELKTSDSVLQERLKQASVLEVRYRRKTTWQDRVGLAAESAMERTFIKLWQWTSSRYHR